MTISYKPGTDGWGKKPIPYIRIANKFLYKYGFKYGAEIFVEYTYNKITIYTLKGFNNRYNKK